MRVLLDTCVLSELRRLDADPRVRRHVSQLHSRDSFMSVITFGEVAKGVSLLPDGRRRRELESWMLGLEKRFESRILQIDRETGRIWGELTAHAQKSGFQVPPTDGLIAATAIRNGLHVMTRNTRDVAMTGAHIVDPWAE